MTRKEAASCINTIVILKNLCYRVRGLMDVIDAQNCDKIIEMLNTVGEMHKNTQKCTKTNRNAQKHTETHACDVISRQDAIDAFGSPILIPKGKNMESIVEYLRMVIQRIKDLPTARPERKKGTYTVSGENAEWYCWYATCNECGKEWMGSRNFCPNCGADMRQSNAD